MRKIFCLLVAVATVAVYLYPAGLEIPPGNFSDGWSLKGAPRTFNRNGLYGHINGGSELFLEFGFDVLTVQRYAKGEDELALETYKMTSPEAALGIYLMKCGTESPVAGVPGRSTGDPYQLMALRGDVFFVVNNYSGKRELAPDMVALLLAAEKTVPATEPADLFAVLPTQDRVPGSERLIRGMYSLASLVTLGEDDILSLNGEIFGAAADYKTGSQEPHTRIVVPYPDESGARAAFSHVKTNLDSYLHVVAETPSSFAFKDYKNRFGKIALKGNVLTVIVNLESVPAMEN